MNKYWNCKAKYKAETPEGKLQPATCEIIVESSGYTESEARATEIICKLVNTDLEGFDIKPTRLTEIFRAPGEILFPWYKACIYLHGYDEEKRRATSKQVQVLVQGADIRSSMEVLLKHFAPDDIHSIESTGITDVYPAEDKDFVAQKPCRTQEELHFERFGKEHYEQYRKYASICTDKEDTLIKKATSILGLFSGTDEKEYLTKAGKLCQEYTPNMGDIAGIFPALAIHNILNQY